MPQTSSNKNDSSSQKVNRGDWLLFCLAAAGLGLIIAAIVTLWIATPSGAYWYLGLSGCLMLLVGVGLRRHFRFRDLRWPELILLLLIAGSVFSILSPRPTHSNTTTLLSIPADKLVGGSGPLYPGRALELSAFIPDACGTPVAYVFPELEVQELYREGVETVLLSVPVTSARELQAALANEKARFTYRLPNAAQVPTLPTTTPAPTCIPTPPPTSAPTAAATPASTTLPTPPP